MSYFIPSFLQKRILRYALSRLELLDTEGLDLEKLDIGWGRKSTIELKEVGLNIKKLSTLLKLPPNLTLLSAQILLLRLTVPADLYQSGILVEAQGVRVNVDADPDVQQVDQTGLRSGVKQRRPDKSSMIARGDEPRSEQSHVHDPGGSLPRDGHGKGYKLNDTPFDHLPTSVELAKSFLQAEPKEEKAELEASVADSQLLKKSQTSESEEETGVGGNISLPAFLADFLRGVGDRVQLKIEDINLDLNLRIERPCEMPSGSEVSSRPEPVTLRLAIGTIGVDHVTNEEQQIEGPDGSQNWASQQSRRVSMSTIEVLVISEVSLFADLARSTAPSSPKSNHTDSMAKAPSRSPSASNDQSGARQGKTGSLGDSHFFAEKSQSVESVDAPHHSARNTYAGTLLERDGEISYQRPFIVDEHDKYIKTSEKALYSSEVIDQNQRSSQSSSESPSDSMQYASAGSKLQSLLGPEPCHRSFGVQHSPTETFLPNFHEPSKEASGTRVSQYQGDPKTHVITEDSHSRHSSRSPPTSANSSIGLDDLTESKIFTHEQASVYMSALSDRSEKKKAQSLLIPGDWDSASSISGAGDVTTTSGEKEFKSTDRNHEALIQSSAARPIVDSASISANSLPLGTRERNNEHFSTTSADHEPTLSIHERSDSPSQASEACSVNLKSSLAVPKTIISVDSLVAILPVGYRQQRSTARDHGRQFVDTYSEMPGGFEQASRTQLDNSFGETFTAISPNDRHAAVQCSVVIGEVQILSDMGLTRLTILLSQRLNTLINSRPAPPNLGNHQDLHPAVVNERGLRLTVETLRWYFLDAIKAKSSEEPIQTRPKTATKSTIRDAEILLRASMKAIRVVSNKARDQNATQISIGKFCFGYSSDKILSFDSGLKLRESTRDVLAPTGSDIVLVITQNARTFSADLTTLPLHISLDLRRLDETFGWFGGFSSMLGLGSSMMSTVTIVDTGTQAGHTSKSTRGVHFESPGPNKPLRSSKVLRRSKFTARIGGLGFDLQGTQSSLRFESTALKIVSRTEGMGLQVDRLNISGPYLKEPPDEPSLMVQLMNLRIEYLPNPKEVDLTRLLALLFPSRDDNARDDDILLETLLRQRRQGAVMRGTVENVEAGISKLNDLQYLPLLGEDLKKLATVTKYLPEDDRPGLLLLGLIKNLRLAISFTNAFGSANLTATNLEYAQVTFPTLLALAVKTIRVHRNEDEELVGIGVPVEQALESSLPIFMARFIGNEMEPTAKIKIHNLRLEYHVSTIMAMMDLEEVTNTEALLTEMISSVTTITGHQPGKVGPFRTPTQESSCEYSPGSNIRSLQLDVCVQDSIIGLNPRNLKSKAILVLTDSHLRILNSTAEEINATVDVRKASIMVIDSVSNVTAMSNEFAKRESTRGCPSQVDLLSRAGFVSVGLVSAAEATIQVVTTGTNSGKAVDVDIRDELLVIESCADSTQTLQSIFNGLKPPVIASSEPKYMTEVVPIQNMLASLTGEAPAPHESMSNDNGTPLGLDEGDMVDDEVPQNLEFVSSFYNPDPSAAYTDIADGLLDDDLESLASPSQVREIGDKNLLESFQDQARVASGNLTLDFQEDHFGDTARSWDNRHDAHGSREVYNLQGIPLRIRVRDVHVIWNLFDGYDWQHTRDSVSQAVEEVQKKASERLARKDKRKATELEEDEESVIGDFLFNSIYIGIPANRDPKELKNQVNRNLDDLTSESESFATSTSSGSPSRQGQVRRVKGKQLRLNRSRHHKMTFELKGVAADIVVAPPSSGEIQSSIDIRIKDLEIFDHVPTSTWKKFATYMLDAGERQSGTSMIHLQIFNVKPVAHLAASEIILKATILPLRLHVDQDALDFLTRFFEFKDDAAPPATSKSEAPFFQRVEVNSVQVKLDFKPKRVDYGGIRSGHTTEFMNFFVLDRADMVLRHVIIYGVMGMEKLGKTLNDIWMPDVKRNQLPGILAGLAPVRSLVNVSSGVRDLVVVPVREYQKDGRVVRSLQKGAVAFAKTTTSELVKMGAKLAIGTHTILQGAEDLLSPSPSSNTEAAGGWEDAELDEEEKDQISKYADQPVGIIQGLRGAYASLERDLVLAKDAIIAMPGEALETRTAGGATKAVLRGAPTVILRPAMGVSKAVGQTLMGATNSLDPANKRRLEEKYKKH
ncbi:autophagy-related protein 2 [Lecanora helva]